MKKFLALALAVLMLASLALSVSAADYPDAASLLSYLYGKTTRTGLTAEDLLAYYTIFGRDADSSLITDWIGACPEEKCAGTAYFRIEDGKIKWACPTCGKSGTISATAPETDKPTAVTAVVCPTCKKSDNLEYIATRVVDGRLKDVYLCTKCLDVVYGSYNSTVYKDYSETIRCMHTENGKTCGKEAKLETLALEGNSLVATYRCGDNHATRYILDDDYYGTNRAYTVAVAAVTGGDSAVRGGTSAKYGESKTVVFYPKTGYVLTSVLVNGQNVAFKNNEVTFIVNGPVTVRPTFAKIADQKPYTLTASAVGSGKISAVKNSAHLSSAAKVEAKRTDTVAFNFTPSGRNYRVADVKIDGRSVGAVTTYSFTNVSADHKVEATFAWKSPYDDEVIDRYVSAVEFVTESGVMGAYSANTFSGTVGITADDLVCALAELCDTAQVLSDATARRAWITANGLAKGVDLTKKCDVQTACAIVVDYLKLLEQKNDVTFVKLDKTASVKDASVALKLAGAGTYDANRSLNRYDLAAICRLIARLEYKG